ncbi:unnamed protein product [Scytosiphon promiscuus]
MKDVRQALKSDLKSLSETSVAIWVITRPSDRESHLTAIHHRKYGSYIAIAARFTVTSMCFRPPVHFVVHRNTYYLAFFPSLSCSLRICPTFQLLERLVCCQLYGTLAERN